MGRLLRSLVMVLLLSTVFHMRPVNSQSEFNVNITPANIDFGTVRGNIHFAANYSIVNQGSNRVDIQITVLQDQNIDVDFPHRVSMDPNEEVEVSIYVQTPEEPGQYKIYVKFRPQVENQGSGGGAAPEFQGSISFTVGGVRATMFQISSGEPNTPLLGFLQVESFNETLSQINGEIEISSEGNLIQTLPISILGGNNTTQLNWSQVLKFEQGGFYTARALLSVNSSLGITNLEKTSSFIVCRSIPWISLRVIEMDSEGTKVLSVTANNNGTLPYLLSLKISVHEMESGETPIVRSISEIIQSTTGYLIPLVVQSAGNYVAIIEGIAGTTPIEETIQLGIISQTVIGPSPPSSPNHLLFIAVGVAGLIGMVLIFVLRKRSKPYKFTIFAIHIFVASGEGLLTYDILTKDIQEMNFDRLGRVVMAINTIEMRDGKFIPVKVNDRRKMLVTLIRGLGFAIEVPIEVGIEEVEKKSNLLQTLNRIENERGDALRNGLVDISADYMEYYLGDSQS